MLNDADRLTHSRSDLFESDGAKFRVGIPFQFDHSPVVTVVDRRCMKTCLRVELELLHLSKHSIRLPFVVELGEGFFCLFDGWQNMMVCQKPVIRKQ